MKYTIYKNLSIDKARNVLKDNRGLKLPLGLSSPIIVIQFSDDVVKSQTVRKVLSEIKAESYKSLVCSAKYFTVESRSLFKMANACIITSGADSLVYRDKDFFETNVLIGSKVKRPDVLRRLTRRTS